MSFRSKVCKTYEAIKAHGKKSLSRLSQITNHSKSSTHRQVKKIEKRSHILGATFFETSDGAQWLRHLIFAVVLVFGLQGNIGAGRIFLFFKILCITEFVGLSARSVGRLKNTMMNMLHVYQKDLQPKLNELAASLSIVAGADETFFDRLMILLFMDLSSGYIFLEESAPNRKAKTWVNKTESARSIFKEILCLGSDRAQSLMAFASHIKTKSIAELYHLQQSVVRLFKFSFAAKRRSLQKQHKAVAKEMDKLIASKSTPEMLKVQEEKLMDIEAQNRLINDGQITYRQQLKEISTVTHPFNHDSQAKTSSELSSQLSSSLSILRNVAKKCGIKDNKKRLNYFENNISEMSALIDAWWQWINRDLENQKLSDQAQQWLKTKLLPVLYWKQQIKKSRYSKELKTYYTELYAKAKIALNDDPLTNQHMSPHSESWAKHWVLKFQRSTSQVEGRNARLSESHHCLRGMNALQIKTDTILHNFWITRDDGTTATERLFKFKPPDLFEWLVVNMPELALPRKRKKKSENTDRLLSAIPAI